MPPLLQRPLSLDFTLFDLAARTLGEVEGVGLTDNPLIRWGHRLSGGESPDDVAWCSSILNAWAHLRGTPRSNSKAARSWLTVGDRLHDPAYARRGWDVVVLTRGDGPQPGPEVLAAPGHVGLFSRYLNDGAQVEVLGGNQGNRVSVAAYNADRILAVQRVWAPPNGN